MKGENCYQNTPLIESAQRKKINFNPSQMLRGKLHAQIEKHQEHTFTQSFPSIVDDIRPCRTSVESSGVGIRCFSHHPASGYGIPWLSLAVTPIRSSYNNALDMNILRFLRQGRFTVQNRFDLISVHQSGKCRKIDTPDQYHTRSNTGSGSVCQLTPYLTVSLEEKFTFTHNQSDLGRNPCHCAAAFIQLPLHKKKKESLIKTNSPQIWHVLWTIFTESRRHQANQSSG